MNPNYYNERLDVRPYKSNKDYRLNVYKLTRVNDGDYCLSVSLRVARHLELIFPLINLHALPFSSFVLTGNLLKTNIFSEFNFVASRHFLS